MLSALAEPPWCVCSAGLGTPEVFPLGVMWQAALLGFPCWLFLYAWQAVREALLFLLLLWWSSALQGCCGGGGGGAPSSGPSGFRRWEPSPFRRLSVPPLAGLEGQGCGALGCRGAAGGLLSALPQHSSSFRCSHPNAFFQPHLHQGGCSGGGHLGLHCQGCCGAYPLTSPDFYSRLFVVWKTSGSWRPVIDLSHLIRFVDVSPFQMGTIQSVLLSVRQGDWMASIDLMEAYLQVPVPPVSRHFLRFMFQDTVYQFKALCFGLSTALQVFTRVLAPVSALLHSMGVPYETVSRRLASPVNLSGVPPRGSSDCPPTLSRVVGLWSTPRIPTWFPHWWFSFWGLSSTPPLSGLLRRRSASPGCSRQPQSFSPAPRVPRAYGYRSSASFLRWLT